MRGAAALAIALFASSAWARHAKADEVLGVGARHVQRAEAYARAGSDVLAEAHFREAVHAEPRNVAAYLGLARVLVRTARRDEAAEVVSVALEIDPADLALAALAAALEVEAGRTTSAMAPLVAACRARPTVSCFRQLADVAEQIGAHPEALTALRRARALGADDADTRVRIASLEAWLAPMLSSATAASASRPASPGPRDGSRAPSPGCTDTPPTEGR